MPVFSWVWRLASPPDKLWPLISDTDRFNREARLPPLTELPDDGGAEGDRKLCVRVLGIPVVYYESAFEWVRPRRFSVRRRYVTGPLREMRVTTLLEKLWDGGTRLGYQVDMRPRHPLLEPVVRLAAVFIRRRFGAAFLRFDRIARADATPVSAPETAERHFAAGGRGRLQARYDAWLKAGADAGLASRLKALLLEGGDRQLARIRPYAVAASWGESRRVVLELCLAAVRAGLLDFRWDLLCPSCRGAKYTAAGLRDVKSPIHCDACRIDFRTTLDRSVEVTFRPNAAIRVPETAEYCVGGPGRTPHVALKLILGPGAEAVADPVLETGLYRLRSPSLPGALSVRVAADGEESPRAAPGSAGWPAAEAVWQPRAKATLVNTGVTPLQFLLERTAWADDAATAAEVTALQAFRDLFAEEALRPGEEVSVGSLAFLFTDLRGSTRLYREVGDAKAFALVMEHFDLLKEAIAGEGGAVVKTIGDAVMAVFPRPAAALRAAAEGQRRMAESMQPMVLKAGVHCGSCIAVNQNERLDYFGSTLNLSARLLGFCAGGDVVVTREAAEDPEAAEWLARLGNTGSVEDLEAEVRGFEGKPIALKRIRAGSFSLDRAAR
jgi:class 3 adenylate cyclase